MLKSVDSFQLINHLASMFECSGERCEPREGNAHALMDFRQLKFVDDTFILPKRRTKCTLYVVSCVEVTIKKASLIPSLFSHEQGTRLS